MNLAEERTLEDLQIRHYFSTTIRICLHAMADFAQRFGKPPDQPGAEAFGLIQSGCGGEIPSLFATGLGPTRPGSEPASPFLRAHWRS